MNDKTDKKEEDYSLKATKDIDPPKSIDEVPKGIRTELNELKEQLKIITETKPTKLEKKKFKLPGSVKRQTRKLKKLLEKNKIQVMLLKTNRDIQPTIGEIKHGMLLIGDKIYDGSSDIVWIWNGKTPTAIVAEWDIKPLTPEYLHAETVANNRIIHPQTIMIRAMELKEILQGKGKFSPMMLIIIGFALIVVLYIIFNNTGG